jgi:hypothetical protein
MTATKDRVFFIWVTAHYPHVDHAVSDEEMGARDRESRGEFRALCGAGFLPAPGNRPPGRQCPGCVRFLCARASLVTAEQRLGRSAGSQRGRHARPGWWNRLWRGEQGSGGCGG